MPSPCTALRGVPRTAGTCTPFRVEADVRAHARLRGQPASEKPHAGSQHRLRGRASDRRAAPLHPVHDRRSVGGVRRRAAGDGHVPSGDRQGAVLERVGGKFVPAPWPGPKPRRGAAPRPKRRRTGPRGRFRLPMAPTPPGPPRRAARPPSPRASAGRGRGPARSGVLGTPRRRRAVPGAAAVWAASDCTTASVFLTRWLNSLTSSSRRSSARLRSVRSRMTTNRPGGATPD